MARAARTVFYSSMPNDSIIVIDVTIDTTPEGASPVLHGVLGIPAGSGPWPAVVVVHEAFGIEGEMRKQVAHLASLGYLTVMPDLFSDGGARKCLMATMKSLRSGSGRAYLDIAAARQWILARPDALGTVGVIGFCMGGGFALMTASSGFDAAASNDGMLPTDPDDTLRQACPVIGSYGAKDSVLKGATTTLETVLTRHGVVHDLKEYPNAGHAFMNEAATGPVWFRPFARVMRMGPDPDAAADAWGRIDVFFREHLSPQKR